MWTAAMEPARHGGAAGGLSECMFCDTLMALCDTKIDNVVIAVFRSEEVNRGHPGVR